MKNRETIAMDKNRSNLGTHIFQIGIVATSMIIFGGICSVLLRRNPAVIQVLINPFLHLSAHVLMICGMLCMLALLSSILHFKYRRVQYLVLLLPVIIIVCGKMSALFATSLYLAASVATGVALVKAFRVQLLGNVMSITSLVLSLFLGLGFNSLVVWVAMHFPVNFSAAYFIFFLAELFWYGRNSWGDIRECFALKKSGISPGEYVIVLFAIFLIFYALVPFYLHDDLVKHLYIPKLVSLYGFFDFHPRFAPSMDVAIIPQSSYVAVYLLDGEYAVRLLNFSIFFLSLLLLEDFIRRTYDAVTALFAVLVCASTPFILWILGVIFIDTFCFLGAVSLFVMFMMTLDDLSGKNILLLFCVGALALLNKLQNMYLVLPVFVILAYEVCVAQWGTRKRNVVPYYILGGVVSLAILLPVLAHNYLVCGNPVFPFYNALFKSEWFDPVNFSDKRWNQPLSWKSIVDLTFNGSRYVENMDYSFGFSWLMFGIFTPLVFLTKTNLKKKAYIFLIVIVSLVLWFKSTGPYMRYYITCMPAASLLIGSTLHVMLRFVENKLLNRMLLSLIAGTFVLNCILLLNVVNVTSPYPVREALSHEYSNSTIKHAEDAKNVFNYASLMYSKDKRCLLIGMSHQYFADFHVEALTWHYKKTNRDILDPSSSADQLVDRIFNKHKFDFIIMPEKVKRPIFNSVEFRNLLQLQYASDGYCLFTRKGFTPENIPGQ